MKAIREINPNAKIIIAGDNDIGNGKNVGKEKAIEAAKMVKNYYTILDTDFKCDWDDYRQQYGLEKILVAFDENLLKSVIKNVSKLNMQNNTTLVNVKVNKELSSINLSQMASSQRAQLLNEYYDFNLALDLTTKEIYHYKDNYWQVIDEELLKRALTDMFIRSGEPFNPLKINSAVESLRLTLPLMDNPLVI